MELKERDKILFIINPGSGNHSINWSTEIKNFFAPLNYLIELYFLERECNINQIKDKIALFNPGRVVAVGGDGTVGLVAQCVLQKNIPFGILPAGSANGLAKELKISEFPANALQTVISGNVLTIHATMVNENLCVHLSDIGVNAKMIKQFQTKNIRGFWGYFIANINVAWNTLLVSPKFKVQLNIDDKTIERNAVTIIVANATAYGSGAVINPGGSLADELFEVIIIRKISFIEVFKMLISHDPFNPQKTEVFSTRSLQLKTSKKIHFQVDGEYLGKVDEIEAHLIPAALQIIVPNKG